MIQHPLPVSRSSMGLKGKHNLTTCSSCNNLFVIKITHIMYNVQDYCVLYKNAGRRLCVRVGILLTFVHHLHNHIISLRRQAQAHNSSFIEVPLPRQESGKSCICVLGVSIQPLSTILIFDFGIILTMWYFLFCFSLYHNTVVSNHTNLLRSTKMKSQLTTDHS